MQSGTRFNRYLQSVSTGFIVFATLIAGAQFISPPAIATERVVAPEKNPPGDIPDNQVFINHQSPLGFSLKVPEGWARTDRVDGVRFADKFNIIDITVSAVAGPPSVASVTDHDAAALAKSGRAIKLVAIKPVTLPAGQAIVIVYTSNSAPNPVTSRQLRLEHNRYLFYRAGKQAVLDLAAPQGADNVDQWRLMARSFRWH
ncbi:hypothetical protein OL229_07855 [Neisseriaceae bacterium JH1-16]|nr:hypothetical protein [Neisseriaceae bacterium JH1-16]